MSVAHNIQPWGRNPRSRGFTIVAWLAMACLVGIDTATASDAETLGEVQLAVTKQPPPPPAEQRPRVALLLIDCSSSMREGIAGPGSPQRWPEMRKNLEQTLKQLLAVSPGIEVRLRFFGTYLDCLGQGLATAKLVQAADVDVLMAKVPPDVPNKSECTTTSLFESTVKCVKDLRKENEQRKFDWWMFGVFSDGKDGPDSNRRPPATTTEQERNDQLEAMKREGGLPLVWTVGPDAEKAAKTAYGPALVLKLGDFIPNPPKPKTRYTIELGSGQSPGVQIDHAAKAGRYKLLVNVVSEMPAGKGLLITPSIVGASPFRMLTKEITVRPGAPTLVEVDLPQDVDRADGASACFAFCASPALSTETESFEGEPRVTFTYTADRTLPPDQWQLAHEQAERRGAKTLFAAAPGQATSPQWTFKGPNGAVERENGLVVSHAFLTSGKWDCEFSCISESGAKLSRLAEPIEIVDAAFSISPGQASIGMDEPATFKIVPAQTATSPATYECLLDGQEVPLGPDGKTITLPPGNIEQIGRHTLAVVAKSRVGGFEWRNEAAISVKASPRVGIMPTEFVEGRDSVPVTIQAAGDIGGSVIVLANGQVVDEYPAFYPSPDVQVAQIEAKIPTADLKKPELDIAVRPKKEGACPEARATLKGRAADIHAALKSPSSGTRVSAKGGRPIVLEPAGDNAGDVGDIEFEVALGAPDEPPKECGLIADEANRWTVALPRRPHLGKTDIYAKPVGGRLRPDLFPNGKAWRRIGSLEIVPEAQWISFILWLLVVLGVLYFTWTALAKNEARHWIVQTTLRDPGQAAEDAKFDGLTKLRKRSRASASDLSGQSQLQPYEGWPLRNWSPRLPRDFLWWNDIGSKDTTLLLWQLAAKHNAKWLRKAVASNPNLPIVVRGGRKQQPFAGLPDNTTNGQPWEKTRVGAASPDTNPSYSETYRLRWLGSPQNPSLWIRVKQPHKFCWEHWAMGSLVVAAVPLIAYLLIRFHCV